MPQTLPKHTPYAAWLAGLTLLPEEADASRRDAARVVAENQAAAARFAFGHASLAPAAAFAACEAPAMVPQLVQQQQAKAGGFDPLCPVMDAAYFERMAAKLADPTWPNIEPIMAKAAREIEAAAARHVADQKATAARLGIEGPLALAGRYGRAA